MDVGRQRCGCSFRYRFLLHASVSPQTGREWFWIIALCSTRDDYTLAEFEEMHHFTYDRMQLKSMFPNL